MSVPICRIQPAERKCWRSQSQPGLEETSNIQNWKMMRGQNPQQNVLHRDISSRGELHKDIYTEIPKRSWFWCFLAEKIHKYCLETPLQGSLMQVQNSNKTGRCFSFNIHLFMLTVFCPTPPTCPQQLCPYKCFWEDVLLQKAGGENNSSGKGSEGVLFQIHC